MSMEIKPLPHNPMYSKSRDALISLLEALRTQAESKWHEFLQVQREINEAWFYELLQADFERQHKDAMKEVLADHHKVHLQMRLVSSLQVRPSDILAAEIDAALFRTVLEAVQYAS
jgi:hypothetical protein